MRDVVIKRLLNSFFAINTRPALQHLILAVGSIAAAILHQYAHRFLQQNQRRDQSLSANIQRRTLAAEQAPRCAARTFIFCTPLNTAGTRYRAAAHQSKAPVPYLVNNLREDLLATNAVQPDRPAPW